MKPEEITQSAICKWLSLQHRHVFEHVIKIDNEGIRSIQGHKRAVHMGLHKGASDLFIAWPTLKHYGLFMEIKPDGWKGPRNKKEAERIEEQLYFIGKMNKKGYYAKLIVGIDQGINLIQRYLKQEF
jgi:hypothetical protein